METVETLKAVLAILINYEFMLALVLIGAGALAFCLKGRI